MWTWRRLSTPSGHRTGAIDRRKAARLGYSDSFNLRTWPVSDCSGCALMSIVGILEWSVIERVLAQLGVDPQPATKGPSAEGGQGFATQTASTATNTSPCLRCQTSPVAALRHASARSNRGRGNPCDVVSRAHHECRSAPPKQHCAISQLPCPSASDSHWTVNGQSIAQVCQISTVLCQIQS